MRKVLSSPYPYAFCSHYIYSITCFLFVSVTKFMCESPELRRIFFFPSPLPPPPREDTFKCLSISLKRSFLQLLAFCCCLSLLFCMNYIMSSVLSSHPCSSPPLQCAKRCTAEREKCRKREKRNYWTLKIADPLQLLMLREDFFFFFMWEGWAIFTKLLGCLVIRQKFNCNNMFSSFLPDYREVWR